MAYRGSLIANAFNTDWEIEYGTESNGYLLRGVPRLFANGSCNCVVSSDCQRPLRIGPPDLVLPGLVVGCSPLYGFRLTTLECLYSSACIGTVLDYIHYYMQTDGSEPSNFTAPKDRAINIAPLMASEIARFSPTDSIGSLADALFIEQSSKSISYESYFAACAPVSCYYTYVRKSDPLYVVTSLLGLYGGLTISLRFIAWNASRIYHKIKSRFGRRTTAIEPFAVENIIH